MAKGDPILSPLEMEWTDDQDPQRRIHIAFFFEQLTGVLTGAVTTKDDDCTYNRFVFGNPSSEESIRVEAPDGTGIHAVLALNDLGLRTLTDVTETSATVEP